MVLSRVLRLHWGVVLLVPLLVALIGAPAAGQATADVVISTPAPRPGAVLPAGDVDLHAEVSAAVTAARFVVDGEAIPAELRPAGGGTRVSARAVLPPGEHVLAVEAEGPGTEEVRRQWRVTATQRSIRRHAGTGRIETAIAVSVGALPDGADAAVLARADDFADALAGAPLAAVLGGPLLLTPRDALPASVAQELQRVLDAGAPVHLLGGTAALSAEVARAVEDLGFRAVRHGGGDRYATAAAIADHLPAAEGAVLASGTSFPDALAASTAAAGAGMPILLTAPGQLPPATRAALLDRGAAEVMIAGGTAAVDARVEAAVREVVPAVRRVAGPDRFATAAAIAADTAVGPSDVALASGTAFPDALSGAWHAVALGQPLLLTTATTLPPATAEAIRSLDPQRVDVYGGAAAVGDHVAVSALRAAIDGTRGPRLAVAAPAAHEDLGSLDQITVGFDRDVDAARSSVYVEVAGRELHGSLQETGTSRTLTYRLRPGQLPTSIQAPLPARVVLQATAGNGAVGHHEVPFRVVDTGRAFATTGPVSLHLPSSGVALIGYHQAINLGAQNLEPRAIGTATTTLPSRGRATGARTSADIVASPSLPVLAPVSGRVVRAGSYRLYCRYSDDRVAIEPDGRPGWEVRVLHFQGLQVRPGDRVVAGQTVIGSGPRLLPFTSQIDRFTSTGWPHVHVEVVDPSIPNPPGSGC